MLTSTRYQISYPNPATRADTADVPRDINAVVTAIEKSAMYGQGSLSSRPVSTAGTPGIQGRFYVATDQNPMQCFYDYGTGWVLVGADPNAPLVPVGGSLEWDYAAGGIPAWAVLQYGQAISRTTYAVLAALAAAAAYPHGNGDGSTTFNIADKRGRVSAGKDDMGGTVAGRITAAISGTAGTVLGAAIGAEGVTITTGQMPSHNHALSGAPTISGSVTLGGSPSLTGAPAVVGAPQLTGAPAMVGSVVLTGAPAMVGSVALTGSVGFSDPTHAHYAHSWGNVAGGTQTHFGVSNQADYPVGVTVQTDYAGTGIVVNNGSLAAVNGSLGVNAGSLAAGNGSLAVNAGSLAVNAGSLAGNIGSLAVGIGSLNVNSSALGVGLGTLATVAGGGGGSHLNAQPTIIVNKIVRAL